MAHLKPPQMRKTCAWRGTGSPVQYLLGAFFLLIPSVYGHVAALFPSRHCCRNVSSRAIARDLSSVFHPDPSLSLLMNHIIKCFKSINYIFFYNIVHCRFGGQTLAGALGKTRCDWPRTLVLNTCCGMHFSFTYALFDRFLPHSRKYLLKPLLPNMLHNCLKILRRIAYIGRAYFWENGIRLPTIKKLLGFNKST